MTRQHKRLSERKKKTIGKPERKAEKSKSGQRLRMVKKGMTCGQRTSPQAPPQELPQASLDTTSNSEYVSYKHPYV